MAKIRILGALLVVAVILLLAVPRFHAADSLPAQLTDEAYWKLIENSSEPTGTFQSENFLSNETGFQAVIPRLKQKTKPGGVYMGVGPEQNFTYIAAIHPKIAFIIDIRRGNLVEHMIYKSLFELSDNRADFLSRLFSRKRPDGLTDKSTVDELISAYADTAPDDATFNKNLQDIQDQLLKKHKFALSSDDVADIKHIYTVFRQFGPALDYNSGSARGLGGYGGFGGFRGRGMPNYMDLMTATDLTGSEHSYLASEDSYHYIRDMETKNLIVPLTGDFGGPKAIRSVGSYLRTHNATVTAFYCSNVEQYLFQGNGNQNGGWKNFYDNVSMLPLDAASTFIRSIGGGGRGFGGYGGGMGGRGGMRAPNVLASMEDTISAIRAGRVQSYNDILSMSK